MENFQPPPTDPPRIFPTPSNLDTRIFATDHSRCAASFQAVIRAERPRLRHFSRRLTLLAHKHKRPHKPPGRLKPKECLLPTPYFADPMGRAGQLHEDLAAFSSCPFRVTRPKGDTLCFHTPSAPHHSFQHISSTTWILGMGFSLLVSSSQNASHRPLARVVWRSW